VSLTAGKPYVGTAALAAFFICACAPAVRIITPPTATLVARLGTDTITVEQYTIARGRLRGRSMIRSPRTLIREFDYYLRPDGSIARAELVTRRPDSLAAAPVSRVVYTFVAGDSVYVESGSGTEATVQVLRSPPVHLLGLGIPVWSQFDALARRAPATIGDSVALMMYFSPLLGGPSPLVVSRPARDLMRVWSRHMGAINARLDSAGRVASMNGLGSSLNYEVTRADTANIDTLARRFLARDATSAIGALSPRDTVEVEVHGARFTVEYGRPSKRGREIFGAVVPWGRVWRTGANLATLLVTWRDVVIGGVTVPAGRYTMWTLPTDSTWQLIINRQTGQWGTVYDPALDLARIPMQSRRVDAPVEQLTIRVEQRPVGGELLIAWDTLVVSVPFSPR
jgi:hypothetical protein